MAMNKLEAQAIIENTGNYAEDEIDDIIDVYKTVMEHVGYEDKRYDNRFVVKFHDILYYTPESIYDRDEFNSLFDLFCNDMYDSIAEQADERNIDIDSMLHPMCVGSYQAFIVDIPEITEENAIDLAMKLYDEFDYEGGKYVENYIFITNALKDLEDNYMEYWIDFVEANEYFTQRTIDTIKDKYHKDMERRKAAQTLAK